MSDLRPTDVAAWEPPALDGRALRRALASRLAPVRGRLVAVALLVLASSAAVAAGPPLIQFTIDEGVRASDTGAVRLGALGYLAVVLAGGIIAGVRTALMGALGQGVLHGLRHDSLAGVLRLEIGTFERARPGDLQARVTQDVEELSDATVYLVPTIITFAVAVVGGFAAIVVLSPVCALATLLVLPPVALAGRWLRRRSDAVYPEYRRRVADMTGHAVETVSEAPALQSFNAERFQLERFRASNRSVVDAYLAGTAMRNRFYPALALAQATVTAGVLVLAASLAVDGDLTVGAASAVVLALGGMLAPLILLIGQLDQVFAARAALVRVVELGEIAPNAAGAEELPARGSLAFQDVSFSYLPGRPVIVGAELELAPGERVALVGASGSGKSTLTRLATGLARPSGGRVVFGGVDLGEADERSRRQRLVLLPQETFLLDGSIADNVLLARPDLTGEAVADAVDRLRLGEWLASFPDGIETHVGADGNRLSAGGRQLVALLRVVLLDPAVVALDESTSLLDPVTEATVAAALSLALGDRSALIVAHRLTTARRCDRIALVEGGRITAVGSHEELSARPGYRALWTDGEAP